MFDLVPLHRRRGDFVGQVLKSFNDAFDNGLQSPFAESFRTDIREQEGAYLIEAELPGFRKEDIEIDVTGKYLSIRAERKSVEEAKDVNDRVIRRERHYGKFVRQFYVENIEEDAIRAKLQDGILKLEVPKKTKAVPESKRIGIE